MKRHKVEQLMQNARHDADRRHDEQAIQHRREIVNLHERYLEKMTSLQAALTAAKAETEAVRSLVVSVLLRIFPWAASK